jgi:hypothetical protein
MVATLALQKWLVKEQFQTLLPNILGAEFRDDGVGNSELPERSTVLLLIPLWTPARPRTGQDAELQRSSGEAFSKPGRNGMWMYVGRFIGEMATM